MSKIAAIINTEITRLARKEIRKAIEPLQAEIKALKKENAQQLRSIAALEKALNKTPRTAMDASVMPRMMPEIEPEERTRLSPLLIKKLRKRLGVSQTEFAALVGVSQPAVASWEQGRAKPRGATRTLVIEARQYSTKQIREIIEEKMIEREAKKAATVAKKASIKRAEVDEMDEESTGMGAPAAE